MLRTLLLLVGVSFFPILATADAPLPKLLSVFVCQTVAGHHVDDMAAQGTEVMGAPGWKDLDWAYDNSLGVPLKLCERQYVSLIDQAGLSLAADLKAIAVNPDASDPTQCAFLAMQVVSVLKDPAIIAACPHPVYDAQGNITAYEDPPCPPGCDCKNEPQDL